MLRANYSNEAAASYLWNVLEHVHFHLMRVQPTFVIDTAEHQRANTCMKTLGNIFYKMNLHIGFNYMLHVAIALNAQHK